ncbi:MAG: sugar phosphate isomerase/epimerase family protein [bacterium]
MKRRDFLTASAVAGVATVCGTQRASAQGQAVGGDGMPKLTPPEKPAELNLCLQWGAIPGGEMKEKLDFLEANGFGAVEIPSGDWPIKNCEEMKKAMTGRKLFMATACGPSDFSYAEPEKREAEVQKFLPVIEALGAMKSVGLILCPARGKVPMGFTELRNDFVTNTGKRLAEHAAKHGTSIVLEPLRRNETPFLRQVADGARMAADIGPGATVMGDFWHMKLEETSFMGAFICAGKLLSHVHIASLKNRQVPGVDGTADNYVDGFKGLKLIGYRGAVSLEGGFPKEGDKLQLILNMVKLLREQWAQA